MRSVFLFICLCGLARVNAQVSIYDCGLYENPITQTALGSTFIDFYRPCISLDQTYNFSGSFNKNILAAEGIDVLPGFTSGDYDSIGGMDLRLNPKADFDVALMNYSGVDAILRYEKLELGIGLPFDILSKVNNFLHDSISGDKLNPFVEWDIRVQAIFNYDGTNVQEFVDGFYYREMERNYTTNSWDDAGTDHPFRVRFSPPLNGNWTCVVVLDIGEGTLLYESAPFTFTVVESGNPGFAKVHANKKNIERGGEIIMPVGTNLPFDGGPGGETYHHWTHDSMYVENYEMSYWERYVNLVDSYGTEGGRYIRIMNDASNSEVEFEKLGNYYDRLKFASEMDGLLDVCHQNGTMIDFCLMYHLPISKTGEGGKWSWDYGGFFPDTSAWLPSDPRPVYCYASAFNSTEPMDMIYNEDAFKYIKQRYRYYIARYGYSTDIYMFDLINEPWHLGQDGPYEPYKTDATPYGDSIRAAVTKMQTELSEYIKLHLEHKQHLLGVIGYPSASFPNVYSADENYVVKTVNDLSWDAEYIDLVCINMYSARPDRMIVDKHYPILGLGDNNENNGFSTGEQSLAYTVHSLHELYEKPVIFCEVGHGSDEDECSNCKAQPIDMMQFGFTGIAGFHHWVGWRYSTFDERQFWSNAIRAQYHMNGQDVINTISDGNGTWLQGREIRAKLNTNEPLVEQQYFRSANQDMAVGYVYNRTYNIRMLGCSTYFFDGTSGVFDDPRIFDWTNNKMHVQGLKDNTDYTVDWYSFKEGDYIGGECINTDGNGELEVRHPVLSPWTPAEILYEGFGNLDYGIVDKNPLVWYVVKVGCGSGREASENEGTVGDVETKTPIENMLNESTFPENRSLISFRVSPNPFSQEINLNADEVIGDVIIRDSQGKTVKRETINTTLASINTEDLGRGIYFLYSKNWNITYKIIKI